MAQLKDTLIQGSARVTDTLFTNILNVSGAGQADTFKITNTTAVPHLKFSRSDYNYIAVDDGASLIIANGATMGTAYALLSANKLAVYNAYGATLGTSNYYWGNTYIKGYVYTKATTKYPLDIFIHNKAGNQVGEIWYDVGDVDNVTTGAFRIRQFSPKSTAAPETNGTHETYYLPTVATGLATNQTYNIITTKNLASITSVGTLSSLNVSGQIKGATTIWAGTFAANTEQNSEYQVGTQSGAGKIYLYSGKLVTGNKGIYSFAADGSTSGSILTVNQSNQISGIATLACSPTITGTLTLNKTTDASGTANNSPALIVGGAVSSTHLELDSNEVMAKTNATSVAELALNADGGIVSVGSLIPTTATTTANNNTGMTIKGIRGLNNSLINATNYFQSSSGYQWGFNHLCPNIQSGGNTCILTGVANSTNNQGVLEFHYNGSNNADNYVGLGLYGNNGLLKAYKDKHIEIDRVKITNTSGTGHLIFSRGGSWNYINFPSDTNTYLAIGTSTGDTSVQKLVIGSNGLVRPGSNNTQDLGDITHYWKDIYAASLISEYDIYLNAGPAGAHIFKKGGAEFVRINPVGALEINSTSDQDTHKLLVNGNSAFTGKLAFTNNDDSTLTENASIQYDATLNAIKFVFDPNAAVLTYASGISF